MQPSLRRFFHRLQQQIFAHFKLLKLLSHEAKLRWFQFLQLRQDFLRTHREQTVRPSAGSSIAIARPSIPKNPSDT